MRMKRNTEGSYTVEAAVFLPVFLIAVLTVGYLIRITAGTETAMHAAVDEARLAAANAYTAYADPGLSSRIERRMLEESPQMTEAKVSGMRYLLNDGEISFHMRYHFDTGMPLQMADGFDVADRIKCRAWIGYTGNVPMGFDAMEEYAPSQTVYIFPSWGEKYHKEDCTYVRSQPKQTVLTGAIKRLYHSCPRCDSSELPVGSVVYCFPRYGEAYHRAGCDSVEKFTVAMQKDQAESRGYGPCSKCGGI